MNNLVPFLPIEFEKKIHPAMRPYAQLILSTILLVALSDAYDEETKCVDDDTFRQNHVASCSWIGSLEKRRLERCRTDPDVRKYCKRTCGECCEDDASYEFHTFADNVKNCQWLGKKQKRKKRYCDLDLSDVLVKNACPSACGQCKVPWDLVHDTNSCADNEYFRYKDKAFKSCEWIGRQSGRRANACADSEVLRNCPRACRSCCKDDEEFLFVTDDGDEKGCGWFKDYTLRKRKYCTSINRGILVENRCPVSCGVCVPDS